jgi:transposase
VTVRGPALLELTGIGPSSAARLLADVGDIHHFADRDKFASWNGTAPLDASSGNQERLPERRVGARLSSALRILGHSSAGHGLWCHPAPTDRSVLPLRYLLPAALAVATAPAGQVLVG